MNRTEPIREKEALDQLKEYYKTVQPNPRNYALIICGFYTALRITDLLNLKWENVYDFKNKCYKSHILLREKKTKKQNMIALNHHVSEALEPLRLKRRPQEKDYIFTKSTNPNHPICRSTAFRIVKKAVKNTSDLPYISCHSLRKTFGYQAWKQGTQPALIMDIYNHSSFSVTKRYLGINQDEKDSVYTEIEI